MATTLPPMKVQQLNVEQFLKHQPAAAPTQTQARAPVAPAPAPAPAPLSLVQENNAALQLVPTALAPAPVSQNPPAPTPAPAALFEQVVRKVLKKRPEFYRDFVAQFMHVVQKSVVHTLQLIYFEFQLNLFNPDTKAEELLAWSSPRICETLKNAMQVWSNEHLTLAEFTTFNIPALTAKIVQRLQTNLQGSSTDLQARIKGWQQLTYDDNQSLQRFLKAFVALVTSTIHDVLLAYSKLTHQFRQQLKTAAIKIKAKPSFRQCTQSPLFKKALAAIGPLSTLENVERIQTLVPVPNEHLLFQGASQTMLGPQVLCEFILSKNPEFTCPPTITCGASEEFSEVAALYLNQFGWLKKFLAHYNLQFQKQLAPLQQEWIKQKAWTSAWKAEFGKDLSPKLRGQLHELDLLDQARTLREYQDELVNAVQSLCYATDFTFLRNF